MRAIRDADITMPPAEFLSFISEAVEGGGSQYASTDDPSELEKVLVDFERTEHR
jgi:hypothetical protein